jgi:two-component system response regulator FixJ
MRLALSAALPATSDVEQTARPGFPARPMSGDAKDCLRAPDQRPGEPGTNPPRPAHSPVPFVSSRHIRRAVPGRPMETESHVVAGESKTVTIVDADDAIGAFTTALLERAGYRVKVFRSCEAFLAAEPTSDSGCVLLDMRTPDEAGLGLLRTLRSRETMPPVVLLSAEGDIREAVEAMKLGAADCLARPCLPTSLLEAIGHAVNSGPKKKAAAMDRDAEAKIAALSQRQLQVLKGILKGKPNKIIAYELGLSMRTVEAYRAELLKKLGVRGTAEAVRLALAAGIL